MRAYRYTLPLTRAIELGPRTIDQRQGVLLERAGRWADASPLPHFSRESCDDVLAALRGLSPSSPSLEFALDCLERPLESSEVFVNALLQGSTTEILERTRQLSRSGFQAVKLKVGRGKVEQNIDQDIELVRQIRRTLRADQRLRLDANRAWDWSTGLAFGEAIQGWDIEYIEEPLRDLDRLEEWGEKTGLAYALDETLQEPGQLDRFPSAHAYVVKPTIFGGRARILELSRRGKPLTFSACYESGVGLARIAQLAQEFSPHVPAGLDTYGYLADDVLTRRLVVDDGVMLVPRTLELNRDRLEEVTL